MFSQAAWLAVHLFAFSLRSCNPSQLFCIYHTVILLGEEFNSLRTTSLLLMGQCSVELFATAIVLLLRSALTSPGWMCSLPSTLRGHRARGNVLHSELVQMERSAKALAIAQRLLISSLTAQPAMQG